MVEQRIDQAAAGGRGDRQGLRDRRRHEFRVLDRRERHEVDAVGELIHHVGGDLQAEARLAGAARAGERQQPRSGQQLPGLTHLVVTADKARQLRRQVIRCRLEGPERRKFAWQPVDQELEESFCASEIFEAMKPEILEGQGGWIHKRARRFRHEHLAAVRGAGDSRGAMHVEAEVFVPDERGLAGVQPDTYSHLAAVRPGVLRQGLLRLRRAAAGIERAAEHDEERVAFGAQLIPAMRGHSVAKQRVVGQQHVGVALAELLDQPGRPFDITEKEGDGTGGQAHAGEGEGLSTGSRIWPS